MAVLAADVAVVVDDATGADLIVVVDEATGACTCVFVGRFICRSGGFGGWGCIVYVCTFECMLGRDGKYGWRGINWWFHRRIWLLWWMMRRMCAAC